MAWFLADDNLDSHPKVLRLLARPDGFAALGFWLACGTWSRRNRTSGAVSAEAADASARKSGHFSDASALAGGLVDVGLWTKTADGYQFNDWHDIYRKDENALKRKEKDAERKRRERAEKRAAKTADENADSPHDENVDLDPSPSPSPVPEREREEIVERVGVGAIVPMAQVFGGTVQPRNDAVAPHPESEAAQLQLIRERFAAGLKHSANATATWTDGNVRQLKAVSKWLSDQDGDTKKILDRTLVGFFANERARADGFPIAYLAAGPDKYLKPPPPAALPDRQSGYAPRSARASPGTTAEDHDYAKPIADQLAQFGEKRG